MDLSLVSALNLLLPIVSTFLALIFIILFTRKKLILPSQLFLMFLLGFLLYSVLSGVRSNITEKEVAILLTKMMYILNSTATIALFLTAYTLYKTKISRGKLCLFSIPVILLIVAFFLPDSIDLERTAIDWIIITSPLVKMIYMIGMFGFVLAAFYYFRKTFKKITDKKYAHKIKFMYLSIAAMLVTFILVYMILSSLSNIPLIIQLVPIMLAVSMMFIAFVY
jgi:hypothetical protein